MKVSITFEIRSDAQTFRGNLTNAEATHEALCRAIHEMDALAVEWLEQNVENITFAKPSDVLAFP